MVHVLFVCLGNICRSPLAEGIFKKLVEDRGLQGQIQSDSAGTSGWHIGEPSDPRTMEVAVKHGISIDHYGKKTGPSDFQRFDYIVAMDRSNFDNIKRTTGFDSYDPSRLLMMRDFDDVGKGQDVPDPYYGGGDGFEHVYQILDRSCHKLLDHIVKKNNI